MVSSASEMAVLASVSRLRRRARQTLRSISAGNRSMDRAMVSEFVRTAGFSVYLIAAPAHASIASIALSSSSVNGAALAAGINSLTCEGRLAPMRALTTVGYRRIQEIAIWASD